MLFLAILLGLFALLHLPPQSRHFVCRTGRAKAAVAMGIALMLEGSMHFTETARFVAMMPGWLPAHALLVRATGAAQILAGVGMVALGTRRWAGLVAAALFVLLLPVNVHVALAGVAVPGAPVDADWYRWSQLPLQLVYVAWALLAARPEPPAPRRSAARPPHSGRRNP